MVYFMSLYWPPSLSKVVTTGGEGKNKEGLIVAAAA
jgi:hypothetical protein